MTLQVDFTQMTYNSFKGFMTGVAKLYSGVNSNANFMALFSDLNSIAKRIALPQLNFFTLYGAYEIADNQIVSAVFNHENSRNQLYGRYLTQPDYIAKVEGARKKEI